MLSQVYGVWQVVKTPTIILNNPVVEFYRRRKGRFHRPFRAWSVTSASIVTELTMDDVRRHGLLLLGLQNYEAARARIYSSRKWNKKLIEKFEVYYQAVLFIAKVILKTIYLLIGAREQSKKKWDNDIRMGIK